MNTPAERSSDTEPVHVMLDTETLGTKPGCKILQIGACTIKRDSREERKMFSVHLLKSGQDWHNLKEDPETLSWWQRQDPNLVASLFSPKNGVSLQTGLYDFTSWLYGLNAGGKIIIWANAPSFDCKILEAAFEAIGVKVPWNFYSERCFRTLKNLVPGIEPEFVGVKHNALDDAVHQAVWAERIFGAMRLNWD